MLAMIGCGEQRLLVIVRDDARQHEREGSFTEALADYQEYVSRAPTSLRGRCDVARLLVILDDPKLAREHMEIAYSLAPNREKVVAQYCETVFLTGDLDGLMTRLRDRAEGSASVDEYLRLAHWALEMGDIDEARSALLAAARLAGDQRVEPYIALADLAERLDDPEEAVRRLRQALYVDIEDQAVQQRLRDYGYVPGPTIATQPE